MNCGQPPANPPLANLWLVSDARNDAALADALAALPKQSGFIYRHYHLDERERRARFEYFAQIARARRHTIVLAGPASLARAWGADGIYGAAQQISGDPSLLKLASAHDAREIIAAERAGADAILLSPVFATNSHPQAKPLGPLRFRQLATRARVPVIALGGMNRARASSLGWRRWAAIDGLSA